MSANYDAWKLQIGDFYKEKTEEGQIRFLLRFAALAPSAHNTQPWRFSIEGNEVFFWINRDRSLAEGDPNQRQLMIAFGCAIENFLIAADHYGFVPQINYFPDKNNADLIARISVVKKDHATVSPQLIGAIPLRHTNRGNYHDKAIPKGFIDAVHDATDKPLKVFFVTDRTDRHAIADIVNDAQIAAMESPMFREELSHYMRSSFTKEHTGMPGFALEIPAPVSLLVSRLVKRVNFSKQNKKKDDMLLKDHTSTFVVITSEKNEPLQWLAVGRLLEQMWLMATEQGMACSPLAAAIQSPSHCEALKKVLATSSEPQVFFRLGYPQKQFRHSPRFTVDQLIMKP